MSIFIVAVRHQLIFEEMLIRLAFAVFAGGAIGYEREYKNRPAGFRTHILVCVGACIIALVQVTMNEEIIQRVLLNPNLENVLRADYGRLSAQVISGVGFLGAGTIIHNKGSIKGLTTAATLWLVACLGLAIGYGYYTIGITGLLISFLALVSLKRIQTRLFYTSSHVQLEMVLKNASQTMKDIDNYFERKNIYTENLIVSTESDHSLKTCVYTLNMPRAMSTYDVIRELSHFNNILGIKQIEDDH